MSHLSTRLPSYAAEQSVISGTNYRISVLSSQLVRLEYSADGQFNDFQTPQVVNRAFPVPEFTVTETESWLQIRTKDVLLNYNKQPFSASGLSITLLSPPSFLRTTWHYGDDLSYTENADGNLGGTARTLDGADGAIGLEPGLLSRYGFAVVDDSGAIHVGEDGWVGEGTPNNTDLYFFGHGLNFAAALKDFHVLSGENPLIPRGILGNWWSRYWKYTQQSYLELMDHFAQERVPFSVAVLDMDWHLVDVDPRFGSGWTGYTWNRELFPEPETFLAELHHRGMAVTLNVHPADGVRGHEEAYPEFAAEMGLDPAALQAIDFDATSPKFMDAYLRLLHHPLEKQGVDFWWLDWQSGNISQLAGLDPLWLLNDVHYADSARGGERALTFSRYSGIGSHRYPIGFSGDAITTWASLAFQPRFTATAANVSYPWWSHDIGGHIGGVKSNELATRWVQFGVFSPINRLHSSADPFHSKDPADFPEPYRSIMGKYLRLRHLLVPYLYSAAWRTHADGVAVVRPMYHDYPREDAAYSVPDQYLFGADMIACPVTAPVDRESGLARTTVWLPEGEWTDLFTGKRYQGGRHVPVFRYVERSAVFVRTGATVALLPSAMDDVAVNPEGFVLRSYPGSGKSQIFEDDGSASPSITERAEITVRRTETESGFTLEIRGERLPVDQSKRELTLDLPGVASVASVSVNGTAVSDAHREEPLRMDDLLAPALRIALGTHDLAAGVRVECHDVVHSEFDAKHALFSLLHRAEIPFDTKGHVYNNCPLVSDLRLTEFLETVELPASLRGAIVEALA